MRKTFATAVFAQFATGATSVLAGLDEDREAFRRGDYAIASPWVWIIGPIGLALILVLLAQTVPHFYSVWLDNEKFGALEDMGEIDAGFAMAYQAKRASHIDPLMSSNAIMQRALPLLRREQ